MTYQSFATEVEQGSRFTFGQNWYNFLRTMNEERINEAQQSLQQMLAIKTLAGKKFLDVGCGSGLFSLAARRLGATVYSFDLDPQSVACATELKRRYFPSDSEWIVKTGSVLDKPYLESLGQFDIVYSWGVLHHTGAMMQALENVAALVAPGGKLFISIYNDQGLMSRVWFKVKQTYNRLPPFLRTPYLLFFGAWLEGRSFILNLITLRPQRYIRNWTEYYHQRGMSHWHDIVDWVGGYPFEVATPETIFAFYAAKGFLLRRLITCKGGYGCNQFVLENAPQASEGEGA